MEHIANQGFTALAYDHPAHGQSEGVYGHIPAFVLGLEAVLDSLEDVAVIVCQRGKSLVRDMFHQGIKLARAA